MNKYEQLIEFIVNEQEDKAKELFHQIVVEKSRDIYESLMDEDELNEFGGNPVAELSDEVTADDEGFDSEDMGDDEMGGEGEEELEDRVMDLESALDDLRAEFDALMADEEGEAEHNDGDMDPDFGDEEGEMGDEEDETVESASVYESDDFEIDEEDEEEEELEESEEEDEEDDDEVIREYVEKVSQPGMKSEGGEVAKGGSASVNKQSIVAGKNDMGGTAANIVKGGDEGGNPSKTTAPSNAYKTKSPQKNDFGNRNVPGGKANSLEKAPAAKKGE